MNAAEPSISVVIPCYNQAHFVADAVESVLQQTFAVSEIIVIDDGSTDEPSMALGQFPEIRIVQTANHGLAAARNKGLAIATSDYITFLDADDCLLPEGLARNLDCLRENPQCGFVYGAFETRSRAMEPPGVVHFNPVASQAFDDLLDRNRPNMIATVLFDREVLAAHGGFREDFPLVEDYELYLRLARHHRFACHEGVVAIHRRHDTNASRDLHAMLASHISALDSNLSDVAPAIAETAYRNSYSAYAERAIDDHSLPIGNRMRFLRDIMRTEPLGTAKGMMRAFALKLMPGKMKTALKRHRRARIMQGGRRLDLGVLDRATPLDSYYGLNRGTAVDRFYIERFIGQHAAAITGHVLEVGDDRYTSAFGSQVSRSDILHHSSGDKEGVWTGDLSDAHTLPSEQFDCIIAVQTLQYIADAKTALHNFRRALKVGGTLLLTVPCLSPQPKEVWPWNWLFTRHQLEGLLEPIFADDDVLLEAAGNSLAVTCLVNGIALEEIDRTKLEPRDEARPVVLLVKATRS